MKLKEGYFRRNTAEIVEARGHERKLTFSKSIPA
jgi:hypothetical protein